MVEGRIVSVIGLAFGDCGKGLFTDYLCRAKSAHTVVRFNGGAQAGHNVVLPDGRHHTFSQFGAGTFNPGVATVLSAPVVIHPTALLVEEAYLQRAGVGDALDRLSIDARCLVTTPYHEAAGRLRERARGPAAHGSCGVGFGETVGHALARPEQALRYADLLHPSRAHDKLEAMRQSLRATLSGEAAALNPQDAAILDDPGFGLLWLEHARRLIAAVPPCAPGRIAAQLARPGNIVMEGAQGMLLDEWHGFHPHTTWSSTGPAAAEAALAGYGLSERITHLGAMRSYFTRHGQGPMPTEDHALRRLAEPHNNDSGWQGRFRRGHPDAVLLRYALAAARRIDGLLVSHLDAFESAPGLRWAHSYNLHGHEVHDLAPSGHLDLSHTAALCEQLNAASPNYAATPIANAEAFLRELEAISKLPVVLGSHGPTWRDVAALPANRA
ncbi:adenylosuccinate synthetase [Duganella sp. Root336D2]|uniref:adenylosuccinate synthetase n=1 Tax=Duganella sp. Root336D2 TaxID=1736518 RepID=UPI0006FB28AB|nr:adenylosuccinate synthetase [Duganella sp. Root336D2]KQV51384.1 adenylosuccinate synthase [Duganella sp. Root336D2]